MPAGRPTDYSQEIVDTLCERISDGESLRSICAEEGMPAKSTVFGWLADPENQEFRTKYALAREAQADALVDEMTDIADDGSNDWMEKKDAEGRLIGWQENGEAIRRSALRISSRQWIAEKLKPKKYGNKVALAGDAENPIVTEVVGTRDLAKAVASILAKGVKVGGGS